MSAEPVPPEAHHDPRGHPHRSTRWVRRPTPRLGSSSSGAARSPASSSRSRPASPASGSRPSTPSSTCVRRRSPRRSPPRSRSFASASGATSGSSSATPTAARAARSTRTSSAKGIERIEGAHCFEFYAGAAAYEALQEEEVGTFYLTDFLARQFDSIIVAGLGLDRHPELRDAYFGNYRRLIYLAQTDDDELTSRARAAADRLGPRLRAALDRLRRTRRAHRPRHPGSRLSHGDPLRHLVAGHPRPGRRQGRPPVEQGRPPSAVPGRHRQGGEPRRQARIQLLHRANGARPSSPAGTTSRRSSGSRPSASKRPTTSTTSPS